MDRVINMQIREMFRKTKGVNERTNESVFRWFGYIERMSYDKTAKRVM